MKCWVEIQNDFCSVLWKQALAHPELPFFSMFSHIGRKVGFLFKIFGVPCWVWVIFSSVFCLLPVPFRKPIVPQKEPSPLLEKKIQQLEAKFAELEGGDEDMEEMGEEEGDITETPSMPQLQTPLTSELDIMPYTPPQVNMFLERPLNAGIPHSFLNPFKQKAIVFYHIYRTDLHFDLLVCGMIRQSSFSISNMISIF